MTMQLDAVLATSRLSKEQAEEIFLLTHKAQALGRKLIFDFIVVSPRGTILYGGSSHQVRESYP